MFLIDGFINNFLNYFLLSFPNQNMKLRQKKARSLSQEAYLADFQNQPFQSLNRKTDPLKKAYKDKSFSSTLIETNKSEYAQILAKFINSANLAKHSYLTKDKTTRCSKNTPQQRLVKSKRIRKASENMSFDEEKKTEHPRYTQLQNEQLSKKSKVQLKNQKSSNLISTSKSTHIAPESANKKKESTQQNIINNSILSDSFNFNDYARFVQSPLFAFSPNLMNAWFQMNPYLKPDWENIPFFAEDMRSGLSRQLQIYERFKPQPTSSEIQKKSLPLTVLIQNKDQNIANKPLTEQPKNKLSPDKIFKRASYHVGIAYSIYMDSIQKEGKKIKNFQDIDPTRFAKKYKSSQQKY